MAYKNLLKNVFTASVLMKLSNCSRRMLSTLSNDTFSVCTFNILAPCYKRLSSEHDRESFYENLWRERHSSIVKLLYSLDINIVCLQEFWFKNPIFINIYKSNLESKYTFFTLQRTGSNDDGLAILVDTKHINVRDKCDLILNDVGDRIGILLNLELNNRSILLINIHLTFPHHEFESRVRLKQIKAFLHLIYQYQVSKNLLNKCSIILCGDFNASCHNDPVYDLIQQQYQSSYRFIHGYEPNVTHFNHRREQVGVDFIFYQSNLFQPASSDLIPYGCNHLTWNDQTEWILSDHRPILTKFKFNNKQNF